MKRSYRKNVERKRSLRRMRSGRRTRKNRSRRVRRSRSRSVRRSRSRRSSSRRSRRGQMERINLDSDFLKAQIKEEKAKLKLKRKQQRTLTATGPRRGDPKKYKEIKSLEKLIKKKERQFRKIQ